MEFSIVIFAVIFLIVSALLLSGYYKVNKFNFLGCTLNGKLQILEWKRIIYAMAYN